MVQRFVDATDTCTMSKPIASYSPFRRAGATVYCSGQIPLIPETGELLQGTLAAGGGPCHRQPGRRFGTAAGLRPRPGGQDHRFPHRSAGLRGHGPEPTRPDSPTHLPAREAVFVAPACPNRPGWKSAPSPAIEPHRSQHLFSIRSLHHGSPAETPALRQSPRTCSARAKEKGSTCGSCTASTRCP